MSKIDEFKTVIADRILSGDWIGFDVVRHPSWDTDTPEERARCILEAIALGDQREAAILSSLAGAMGRIPLERPDDSDRRIDVA